MKKTDRKTLIEASKMVADLAKKRQAREQRLSAKRKVAAAVKAKLVVKAAEDAPAATAPADLEPVKESDKDAGEEGLGMHIPPELQKSIDDAKDDAAEAHGDESASPGVVIPPTLVDKVEAAVVDPSVASSDHETRYDLVPFAPEVSTTAELLAAGAHWVLFANGKPLAEINLKDQDNAQAIAAHFVSNEFARSIVAGIGNKGLGDTLKAVKARTYIATVDTTDKVKQIKAGLEATSTEALRLARAELKAKFNQNLGHAIEAAANNFLVQNPLKDALVAAAVGMGVQEHQASALVDDAFFTHGQTTLAGLLDQAEEWSNTAPEALDTILRAMRGAGRRPRASASVSAGYNHALAARMASAAVAVQPQMVSASVADPVEQPAQPEAQVSSKDAYRAKFGRFNARR